jgi:mediator of RNA polymerase II transcription subunit 6
MSVDNTNLHAQYIDIIWLKEYGVHKGNVLDYFYYSPWYTSLLEDKSPNRIIPNNELCRLGQQDPSIHLPLMVGLEFALDMEHMDEPHLYVIKKQNRIDQFNVQILEIFYVIDGIIYQSPVLLELLRSRLSKTSHYFVNSFNILQEKSSYTSSQGSLCILSEDIIKDIIDDNNDDMNIDNDNKSISNSITSSHISNKTHNKNDNVLFSVREFPSLSSVLIDIESPCFSSNEE